VFTLLALSLPKCAASGTITCPEFLSKD